MSAWQCGRGWDIRQGREVAETDLKDMCQGWINTVLCVKIVTRLCYSMRTAHPNNFTHDTSSYSEQFSRWSRHRHTQTPAFLVRCTHLADAFSQQCHHIWTWDPSDLQTMLSYTHQHLFQTKLHIHLTSHVTEVFTHADQHLVPIKPFHLPTPPWPGLKHFR